MSEPGVVVSGVGRASAPPDVVRLQLAARGVAPTAQGALDAAVAGSTAMRAALVAAGVAAEDVTTTDTSLWREDVAVPGTPGAGTSRFVATLGLSATVRAVAHAGDVLGAALAAAGDAAELREVVPGHADDSALVAEARRRAFEDALTRASQYAELAGRTLGAVRLVDEAGRAPGPRLGAAFPGARSVEAVPVQPGALEVVVTVTVSWDWA